LSVAETMAKDIKSNNNMAVRYAKEAVKRGRDLPLRQGLELEKSIAEIVRTQAGNEPRTNEAVLA
jgi:enoyl-CoA hydratase/carnithine racemase